MSDDGADLGIQAEEGMKAALGAKEEPARRTPAELRAIIDAVGEGPYGYNDGANAIAKAVIGFLERHPECQLFPADSEREYPKKGDGTTDWDGTPTITQEGVYEAIKRLEPETYAANKELFSGMTGFMWGWAVNAAKYCLDLPPVANPAIITIGGKNDE